MIILIAVVVSLSGQVDYAVLYSGLSEDESGAVYTALQEMQVDVRPGSGGTIMVPADRVDDIRMQLNAQGLPASIVSEGGGVNYGSFYIENAMSFGATDKDKEQVTTFQIQQSLTQMINQSEKIKNSTVLLNIAPESQFALSDEASKTSSASVMVEVNQGAEFTNADAQAIKKLIVNAVPALTEEDVSVSDTGLKIYGDLVDMESGSDVVSNQIRLEHEVATRLGNQIASLYSPVFGPENITSSVNVKLDFDKKTTEIITLEPPTDVGDDENKGIATAMKHMVEHIASGEGVEGAPGMDPNGGAPTYQEVVENIDDTDYYKVTEEFNYEVNEIKELIEEAQGDIVDISATVLINGGDEIADVTSDVQTQVATAIGIPVNRITVSAMPFTETSLLQEQMEEQMAAVEEMEKSQQTKSLIQYAAIIGGIVLIVVLILTSLKRRKEMELEAQRLEWMQEQAQREAEHQATLVDVVADEEIDLDDIIEDEKGSTLGKVQNLVQNNPESVAQILRNWLTEDLRR